MAPKPPPLGPVFNRPEIATQLSTYATEPAYDVFTLVAALAGWYTIVGTTPRAASVTPPA